MSGSAVLNEEYWDQFYSHLRRMPPSQFAVLVASELDPGTLLLDVGCGSGRDTFFFAGSGFPAVGFDRSSVAIDTNVEDALFPHLSFVHADASDIDFAKAIIEASKICVYARFFLHAVDAQTEATLLGNLSKALPPGAVLYLEYRTLADQVTEKTFGGHFRRYVDHDALVNRMPEYGFRVAYEIQGRGMAKFAIEDPHVGRISATRD